MQRDRMTRELRSLPGTTVYPRRRQLRALRAGRRRRRRVAGLLDRGVLVRDMTAVVPNALRVTAGSEHETDLFLQGRSRRSG